MGKVWVIAVRGSRIQAASRHPGNIVVDQSQRCRVWAQTLHDSGVAEVLIGEEQTCMADVQSAREKGVQCPALLELVFESLESSGRGPERMRVSDP